MGSEMCIRDSLVSVFGDSVIIERRHHGGTALCDWFAEQAEGLGLEHFLSWEPHVIVVDHGGNALTECMAGEDGAPLRGEAYEAKYLADAEYLVEVALAMNSRVLFVDQPVGRGDLPSGTGEIFRSTLWLSHFQMAHLVLFLTYLRVGEIWNEVLSGCCTQTVALMMQLESSGLFVMPHDWDYDSKERLSYF